MAPGSKSPALGSTAQAGLPAVHGLSRLTAHLVLGHRFERLIADGDAKDYVAIARLSGLSRARVTQIANLTLLSPVIQHRILFADGKELAGLCERQLRSVLIHSSWAEQERSFFRLVGRSRGLDVCGAPDEVSASNPLLKCSEPAEAQVTSDLATAYFR